MEGSPPHGRGIVVLLLSVIARLRITPAWAGNSTAVQAAQSQEKDHPRMGGE